MAEHIQCQMVCTAKRLTTIGCDIVLSPVLKGTPGNGTPYVWLKLGSIVVNYPTAEAYEKFILGEAYIITDDILDDEFIEEEHL